jgi:hypothetical protein
MLSTLLPPRPGETPATMAVPYMAHGEARALQLADALQFCIALGEYVCAAVVRPVVVNDFGIQRDQFAVFQAGERIDFYGVAITRGGGFHQPLREENQFLA